MGFSQTVIASQKALKQSHERRRSPRQDVPWQIVECVRVSLPRPETFLAAMVNSSQSGLCINSMEALREGEEVLIRPDIRGRTHKAVVRWSAEITRFFYRTGLEYLDAHETLNGKDDTVSAW